MPHKRDTKVIHRKPVTPENDPLALPIYQTSTYTFKTPEDLEKYLEGDEGKYLYTRYENPTLRSVEQNIAELESGESCYVFSSGMAAITSSLMAFLKAGEEVLASNSLYGRTQFFMERWLPRFGIQTRLIPVNEFPNIDSYFTPKTKIVYIESPTNPTIQIIDIQATAKKAHEHGAMLFIDNTFASPVNQNPIPLGADVVLHSLTKYIGGHSDVIAGASIFAKTHHESMTESIRTFGGTLDPLAAYLVERGLKTLFVRVERQNQSALQIAKNLLQHPAIKKVHYPGIPSHPGHEIAVRQMRGFGGMLAFELKTYEHARQFLSKLQLIGHGASLGGVESLVSVPVLTSHYKQPPENLKAAGIGEGTIRLSVGIENPDDLWTDIEQALQSLHP
jgi:cystathionine beta-lyase/cystathionine gamma-synthase